MFGDSKAGGRLRHGRAAGRVAPAAAEPGAGCARGGDGRWRRDAVWDGGDGRWRRAPLSAAAGHALVGRRPGADWARAAHGASPTSALLAALAAVALASAVALAVPAQALAVEQVSGAFGVRLEAPVAADEAHQSGMDVGIRLEVVSPAEEQHQSASDIGIRLEVTPPDEERHQSGADVGIRLEVTPPDAERHQSASDIGIRLEAPAPDEERHQSAGNIGIRMATAERVFMVTFDANGGAWDDGDATKTVAAEPDAPVDAPAPPRREGKGFAGWRNESGQAWEAGTAVNRDITLYAEWAEVPVAITYDANGGSFGEDPDTGDPVTQVDAESFVGGGHSLPEDDPAREGCSFAGWWTASGASGAWGDRVTADTTVADDGPRTLYARWIAEQVRVVVEDDAGVCGGPKGTISYGQTIAEAAAAGAFGNVPTREGYMLGGLWWKDPAGASADVKYVAASYTQGAAPAWTPELAGPWEYVQHASDEVDAGGQPGADGIPDTLRLAARWDAAMRATVPVSLTFAVHSAGGDATAEGPDPEAFAIKSYTPAELAVERVAAEPLGGMADVFYTVGEGEARELDWSALGRNAHVSLTLEPEPDAHGGDGTGRMSFELANRRGLARPASRATEAEHYTLAAWQPADADAGTAEQPGVLHIKFGLDLPSGLRARETGSIGEIARVTFTLAARQP